MNAPDRHDYSTPTLMRSARAAYSQAMRAELAAIGVDDLPRNGGFILAGIDSTRGPRQDLPSELGVTKQAVSQALDVLVQRGYLERHPDNEDRRRVALELTDRGQEVVDAILRGTETVDRRLAERVSNEQIEALRATLVALTEIKVEAGGAGTGRKRSARQLRRVSPIFEVRRLRGALEHYTALGFQVFAYEDGDEYGFARRDGVGLQFTQVHEGEEPSAGSAYLFVRDADALYEEWKAAGPGGELHPAEDTPWGMREGSHTDPDGNVIRFGSSLDA